MDAEEAERQVVLWLDNDPAAYTRGREVLAAKGPEGVRDWLLSWLYSPGPGIYQALCRRLPKTIGGNPHPWKLGWEQVQYVTEKVKPGLFAQIPARSFAETLDCDNETGWDTPGPDDKGGTEA